MNYRVNLYPERGLRRGARRRKTLRGLGTDLPLGAAVLIVAFLIVTGLRLTQRHAALEADIRDLEASLQAVSQEPVQDAARAIFDRRLDRIDWAVLMGEMSKAMPDAVSLTEIRGLGRGRTDGDRKLVLVGHLPEGTEDLSPVMDLIGSLRTGRETSVDFPNVALETAKSGAWVDFQIIGGVSGGAP